MSKSEKEATLRELRSFATSVMMNLGEAQRDMALCEEQHHLADIAKLIASEAEDVSDAMREVATIAHGIAELRHRQSVEVADKYDMSYKAVNSIISDLEEDIAKEDAK